MNLLLSPTFPLEQVFDAMEARQQMKAAESQRFKKENIESADKVLKEHTFGKEEITTESIKIDLSQPIEELQKYKSELKEILALRKEGIPETLATDNFIFGSNEPLNPGDDFEKRLDKERQKCKDLESLDTIVHDHEKFQEKYKHYSKCSNVESHIFNMQLSREFKALAEIVQRQIRK